MSRATLSPHYFVCMFDHLFVCGQLMIPQKFQPLPPLLVVLNDTTINDTTQVLSDTIEIQNEASSLMTTHFMTPQLLKYREINDC